MHKHYIWNNKRPKIKHSTLIGNYNVGGYKDIDIEMKISSLKVKWVTKLMDNNYHPWKVIPNLLFSNIGGTITVFHFNLQLSKLCTLKLKQFPLFYIQLVKIWGKVSEKPPQVIYDLHKEILWNNRFITRCGESLHNQYFINKGIIDIHDIIGENGQLLGWVNR